MRSPFETSDLQLDAPGRGRVSDNVMETFGNTPLVHLGRLAKAHGAKADVLVKLEFFNPLASISMTATLST